jgi:orotate phosphoribosyltransferase
VGSRVFDVYSDGTTLLKGFDILREAGRIANRAVIRVFRHVPASPLGKIDLTFVPVVNYALINAIEVLEE